LGGINARFTPIFNLSIQVSKLRGIAQYMPEYDLRDLANKNQGFARNSKRSIIQVKGTRLFKIHSRNLLLAPLLG